MYMENKMTISEILLRSSKSRQSSRDLLRSMTENDLIHPQVEGVWTIKDILGHLASWENACLVPLTGFAEGGLFLADTVKDVDAWNGGQAALKFETPLSTIIEEWETVRKHLETTLSHLSTEQLGQQLNFPWGEQGNGLELLNGLLWHEEEHMKSIKAWLETKK
jgi:hypothetical protein